MSVKLGVCETNKGRHKGKKRGENNRRPKEKENRQYGKGSIREGGGLRDQEKDT
jgi:hypothetical protein